ncbi:MAG: GFA family protein [Sandaracinaceae bacterium]
MTESTNETKTHTGSCHCGAVRFEVDMSLADAGACNCSICRRAGWVVKSVPPAAFTMLSGVGAETDYQFGKKTAHHPFCATCGVRTHSSWGEGDDMKVMINLRCLDGVDADALEVRRWDGASF